MFMTFTNISLDMIQYQDESKLHISLSLWKGKHKEFSMLNDCSSYHFINLKFQLNVSI